MTLHTRIFITSRITRADAEALFATIRSAIGANEQHPVTRHTGDPRPGARWSIGHPMDIGLPAWAEIEWQNYAHRAAGGWPRHYGQIHLDTAYGYRGANGERCGDLHARLIATLAPVFYSHGASFSWMNEYSGAIYAGTLGLDTLGDSSRRGNEWFDRVVEPALDRLAAGAAQH